MKDVAYAKAVATLARSTALSERTVRRALVDLERRGIVSRLSGGGFQIHIDVLEALPKVATNE